MQTNVLPGTLAVRRHHITQSVFDAGPNSIQVLSHTIGNEPSIPLKSASSIDKVWFIDSVANFENLI
jgi:hypothetical protein